MSADPLPGRHFDLPKYEVFEEIGIPAELPTALTFESNKAFVRTILAEQIELNSDRTEYGSPSGRYESYQKMVNADGVPPEDVIDQHRDQFGEEYRLETEGPHPIDRLREPQPAS